MDATKHTAPLPPLPGLEWYNTAKGNAAFPGIQAVLRVLLGGWPRRSRSLLVMHAGLYDFLSPCWEEGFDVTGQEHIPALYTRLCEIKDPRIPCQLAQPDYLPFEDNEFDYAVCPVGTITPPLLLKTLQEIRRVTCRGCILLFPNKLSFFYIENRLQQQVKQPVCPEYFFQPYVLRALVRPYFPDTVFSFSSSLCGASSTWLGPSAPAGWPLPLGAFAGLRIDYGKPKAGAPLLLTTPSTAASSE